MVTKKLLDALYAQTCSSCGHLKPVAAGSSIDLDALLERAMKAVYKNKVPEVQQQLSTAFAAHISEGVKEKYGKGMFDVAFNSPDGEMIRHLQANVYEFSHAKSYQQLRALTSAMVGKDGNIVPFHEFREIASRINGEMAIRHLETEYNTAISSAQMASKWVQYLADEAQFPLLTYQTVGDGEVRPSHAAIDNVTRPVRDTFWNHYYPPNGWGCRCDVIQAVGKKATPSESIATPEDVPPMFQTNTAKSGLVFPDEHPYYNQLPKEVTEAASNTNPFEYEKIHTGKKGGYVYRSPLSNTDEAEVAIAEVLSNKGERIVLLPEVPPNTEWQRQLKTICQPEGIRIDKSVDAISNGRLIEFKAPKTTKSAIDRAIRDANEKVTKEAKITVCIKLDTKVTAKYLRDILKGRLPRAKAIDEVWIVDYKNTLKKYKRTDILKKKTGER